MENKERLGNLTQQVWDSGNDVKETGKGGEILQPA